MSHHEANPAWAMSSPMTNQIVAKDFKGEAKKYPPICIDVPENNGKSTHFAGVIVCGDPERAKLILRAVNSHDALVAALRAIRPLGEMHPNGDAWSGEFDAIDAALALAEAV